MWRLFSDEGESRGPDKEGAGAEVPAATEVVQAGISSKCYGSSFFLLISTLLMRQGRTPQDYRSRGKSHGLAVSAGIARAQIKKASSLNKAFVISEGDRIARAIFSTLGRSQSSASTRRVCLVRMCV